MRYLIRTIVAFSFIGVAYPAAAESMSKAEIEQAVVGKTVRFSVGAEVRYATNGDYTFIGNQGMSSGKYTIADGTICVTFTNGNKRCDKITREGDKLGYELTNGQKWVGSIK